MVDVFVNFLGGHANTTIADGKCFSLFVNGYMYCEVAQLAFEVALHGQSFELLCSVNCVAYYFAKKNLVIAVEEFLDNREYVLCGYTDITFCIVFCWFNMFACFAYK